MFTKKLRMKLLRISFFLTFILLYLLRLYYLPDYRLPESEMVGIIGQITKQPYLKASYQIIEVGPVLIKTARFPGYFYGDKLEIVGRFQKKVLNPFQTRYFTLFPTIRKIENESGLTGKANLRRFLLKTRGQIEREISKFLPEPYSSLLLGVLFGVKSQMPYDFWQNLRKTGTLHLVVASGQNVSMVAGFLIESLTWLIARRKAIIFASLGVVFYVLMVGAEPPAVRAGLMAIMAFVGQLFGREGEGIRFLLASAGIMLLISPLILFDIGFQLSFAAMAGIILIYPRLKKWERLRHRFFRGREPEVGGGLKLNSHSLSDPPIRELGGELSLFKTADQYSSKRVPSPSSDVFRELASSPRAIRNWWTPRALLFIFSFPILGDGLAVTISAQAATLPILLTNFGQLSVFSSLINVLILPTVPFIMIFGAATAGVSLVIKPLAQLLAWFIWPFLAWFVKVVEWFGSLSWISWEIGKLSLWWVVGYYFLLAIVLIKLNERN